jgi:hypothetical protein
VIRVRVVFREVPTSRLPRGRIDDPVIHDVVVVRQIATEEEQIEIAVEVSVVVGFSSNPPSRSNDMIGFICDVSASRMRPTSSHDPSKCDAAMLCTLSVPCCSR